MLELNLWFSATTGKTYGNLTNKLTHTASNIGTLLPIKKFCDYNIRTGIFDEEFRDEFLNHPSTDHNASYGWTKDNKSMVWWNTNNKNAYALVNGKVVELTLVAKRYDVKGSPDMIFRG